jgi:uncharacterized membrane protein
MTTTYVVLKFIHVLAAIVWIGGATALATVTGRLIAARDRATLAALFPHSMAYGQRMAGPSAILVLITGIWMVIAGKLSFSAFWISWGFAGIIAHFVFGATILRKRGMAFAKLAGAPGNDDELAAAGARLRIANLIYLLIMVSVIGAMVLKPTLR